MAMKKLIAAALAVTLLGSTLAGCSSGDKNTGGTDSTGAKRRPEVKIKKVMIKQQTAVTGRN